MDLNFIKFLGFGKKKKCIELFPPKECELEDTSSYKKVFLAGSIEMGKAVDWQHRLVDTMSHLKFLFFNPRRKDWDSSWEQTIDSPEFYGQVMWELNHLEEADIIVMYFDPTTKSPISLLELGLFGRTGKLIVLCPDGFWRKGNVDIVCEKYGITMVENWSELTNHLIASVSE